MHRRALLLAGALLATAGAAHAETLPDWPDVVVFAEPTLLHAMTEIGRAFRAQTGIPVRVYVAPGIMLVRASNHTRNDVLVVQGSALMDEAARIDAIKPATRTAIGGNRLVVARRGPGGDVGLAAALGTSEVALVDAGLPEPTGDATRQALAAAGLTPKAQGVVGTADAVFLLETDKVSSALVFATDVAASPGLSVAAVVPEESYPTVTYLAAASHDSRGANPGRLIALMTSPEGQKILHDAGLEPAP